MGRKRDAGTGAYLSDEEAAKRDKNTWVEESDSRSIKTVLRTIFEECEAISTVPYGYTFNIVTLKEVQDILNKHGAEIE